MSEWKPLPKQGPRRRCLWGGWRCMEPAVVIQEPILRKGRAVVLCEDHYRARVEQDIASKMRELVA